MFRGFWAILGLAFVVAACQDGPKMATPAPQSPAPPPPKSWMVFFDTNSVAISQESATTVRDAAGVAKSMATARVSVTGFTDTTGPVAYNNQLAMRRADAVKNALISNGVAAQSITVTGLGEQDQLVQTPDQTKEGRNRRVQILVQ